MKMKIDTNGFAKPSEYARRHSGEWVAVPSGFRDALLHASEFTRQHNAIYPWTKDVYLLKGKLYASNNICIVEIDLGDHSFGDVHFISLDVKLIRARQVDPCEAQFNQASISFAWPDGTWCKSDRRVAERNANLDHANQCRLLIQRFWHEGRSLSVIRDAILSEVKRTGRGGIIKVSRRQLAEPRHQYWHAASIEKVMRIANSFDPDPSPAPFSFPNGKGLIVKLYECKAT